MKPSKSNQNHPKAVRDNRSNQLNRNNRSFWSSRGLGKPQPTISKIGSGKKK